MDTASKTYFDWKFVLPIGSFYELQNRPYKVEYEVIEGSKRYIKVQGLDKPISEVFFKDIKQVMSFQKPKVGEPLMYYQGFRVSTSKRVRAVRFFEKKGKKYYILSTADEYISGEMR